jgi:hypothetical protein
MPKHQEKRNLKIALKRETKTNQIISKIIIMYKPPKEFVIKKLIVTNYIIL